MARNGKGDGRSDWEVDFVHIDLAAQDKEALDKYDLKYQTTFDTLSRASLDGWKLSVVHDQRNDCSIASFTSPKVDGGARQVCLSARGPDMLQALRVLTYKINVICGGDLGALRNTAQSRSQWG